MRFWDIFGRDFGTWAVWLANLTAFWTQQKVIGKVFLRGVLCVPAADGWGFLFKGCVVRLPERKTIKGACNRALSASSLFVCLSLEWVQQQFYNLRRSLYCDFNCMQHHKPHVTVLYCLHFITDARKHSIETNNRVNLFIKSIVDARRELQK